MRFRDVVRADLRANNGNTRLRQAVSGFLFHPGFATIFLHRVAVSCVRTPLDKLGGLIWAWNTRRSGCHFNLDSEIAPGLALPHPTGIVIGQGVKIGAGVTLYQSVTIGKAKREDYPEVEAGAVIYPNSVVIGSIRIGAGAVIGAGSVVRKDVPAEAVAAGNPARIISPTPAG